MELDDHGCYSWLSGSAFGMLTINSARAIYNSISRSDNDIDIATVSFVLVSYLDLLLLFWALRLFEKESRDSPNRDRMKVGLWILCTILTVMFSWKVAAVMPSVALRFFIWSIASVSSVGGFYALFLHQNS